MQIPVLLADIILELYQWSHNYDTDLVRRSNYEIMSDFSGHFCVFVTELQMINTENMKLNC